MNLSNYMENKLLDFLFRNQPITQPTKLYFALFNTAASDIQPGEEPADPDYHRAEVECNLSNFSGTDSAESTAVSTGIDGTIYNIAPIKWPDPSQDWGTISYIGVFDGPKTNPAANYLFWAELNATRDVIVGDTDIRLDPGKLSVQIDN